MTNPIQYTSRTFNTVLADLNSDQYLVDKPDWWKRTIAGIMDVLSVIENATANQSFLRTAFTRRAVADLCALIDYQITEAQTSSGQMLLDMVPGTGLPHTVAASAVVGIYPGSIAVPSKRFEGRSSVTFTSLTEATAYTAWTVADDKITVASVFATGEKVRLSFSATPPTTVPQVNTTTDYYAIYDSPVSIRLATSRALAYAGTYIDITAQGTGTHTMTRWSRPATVYQQTSEAGVALGTSDGGTAWQEFRIARALVLKATLVVTVNSVPWTRVDTLVDSLSSDTHYKLIYDTDGTSRVQFGDGNYGAIPAAFPVIASYSYGGGSDSNISVIGAVSQYGGADATINGVSNATALSGGDDAQSLDGAKAIAPLLLKTRDRFVTSGDGVALAIGYGGLSLAKVIANAYGILSAKVIGIATGGGNPSAGVKSALQAYLISRTMLESVDVRVVDATITAKAVTSTAKMLPGYSWSTVQQYFDLAWRLLLTETGSEILAVYRDDGISGAVTRINALFTKAFTSASYTAIQQLLDNMTARDFGDSIQDSDPVAFIQANVDGIDYMVTTVPTFPITCAADEITSVGVLSLTEIP